MRVLHIKSDRAAAGFTLLELLLTLAISGIISASIYSAFIAQQRTYLAQDQVAEMQQNLRAGLMMMTRDVRMAGYDPDETNNYGVTSAASSKFVFTADLNDDGGAPGSGETLTYELYTTGAGISAVRRIAGQSEIAENIEAIEFIYLDSSGTDLGDPTSTPPGTVPAGAQADIRSIQVSILARAGKPDRKFTNTITYTPASGVANNWGPYNDNFRRRLLITTVKCRNMGL